MHLMRLEQAQYLVLHYSSKHAKKNWISLAVVSLSQNRYHKMFHPTGLGSAACHPSGGIEIIWMGSNSCPNLE